MICACEPGPAPRGYEETHLLGLTPFGPLPLATLQPKIYFRVGREEKEERKPKGESLRKGVPAPRPPDTSFPQWEIHLASDGAFIKDKTLRQPIPFLSSPVLPSLTCLVPDKGLVLDKEAEQVPLFSVTWVHVTEQGLTDSLSGQVGQQRPPGIQPCEFKNKAEHEEDPVFSLLKKGGQEH